MHAEQTGTTVTWPPPPVEAHRCLVPSWLTTPRLSCYRRLGWPSRMQRPLPPAPCWSLWVCQPQSQEKSNGSIQLSSWLWDWSYKDSTYDPFTVLLASPLRQEGLTHNRALKRSLVPVKSFCGMWETTQQKKNCSAREENILSAAWNPACVRKVREAGRQSARALSAAKPWGRVQTEGGHLLEQRAGSFPAAPALGLLSLKVI